MGTMHTIAAVERIIDTMHTSAATRLLGREMGRQHHLVAFVVARAPLVKHLCQSETTNLGNELTVKSREGKQKTTNLGSELTVKSREGKQKGKGKRRKRVREKESQQEKEKEK